MKFSIVTPVMNGMPHIRRCVGSVRGQWGMQVEHIIQDGGSDDGTSEWLSDQSDIDYSRCKDSGMYDAINKGWSRTHGDILSWLNADEQYLPESLKVIGKLFEHHEDVDVIFADYIITDCRGFPIAARREIPLRSFLLRNSFLYAFSCTLFFRRKLFDSGVLRFDTSYRFAGDADLIHRLFANGVKFYHTAQYLSLFEMNDVNLTRSPGVEGEAKIIDSKYKTNIDCAFGKLFVLFRYAEKLMRGCYWHRKISYEYAVDETPIYKIFENVSVGNRFKW